MKICRVFPFKIDERSIKKKKKKGKKEKVSRFLHTLTSNVIIHCCNGASTFTNLARSISTEILERGASVHFRARGCIFPHRTPHT